MLSGNEINAHDYEIAVEGVCRLGTGGFWCLASTCRARDRGTLGRLPICIPLDWCGSMFRIPDSLEGPDVFLDHTRVWGLPFIDSTKRLVSGVIREHALDKYQY